MAGTKRRTIELCRGTLAIIRKIRKLLYITCISASMHHCGKLSLCMVQRWWIIRGNFLCKGGEMEMGKSMTRGSKGNLARKAQAGPPLVASRHIMHTLKKVVWEAKFF